MLWSFDIYIGDSADYRDNQLCPGGPFLPDGDALDNSSLGQELWCNLEGSYISLIRDYSDYADIEYISICDFAIFGDPIYFVEQREEMVTINQSK